MKAIEITLDWVKQRRAFGATLWDKQVIRQRLSMRLAQVEAARALLFNTAWRDTRNENVVKEVSMLKALAGTLVNEVMYDCVQFHGGMGYMRESRDRAHVARRARAVDRRRRHRGDAGRGRQAHLTSPLQNGPLNTKNAPTAINAKPILVDATSGRRPPPLRTRSCGRP